MPCISRESATIRAEKPEKDAKSAWKSQLDATNHTKHSEKQLWATRFWVFHSQSFGVISIAHEARDSGNVDIYSSLFGRMGFDTGET
jgi:hypothetical protein